MSEQFSSQRLTIPQIMARKGGEPLVCLTAYDAPTAEIIDPYCDIILVGDSVGMVVHGLSSTVGVSLDMMIMHAQAVMRRSTNAVVVVDLPFGSYEDSPITAFKSASHVMMQTGCQAVKIESGSYAAETISYLVERGIPVMAHVGLRPQSINVLGSFRARGRTQAVAQLIRDEAQVASDAGAFAVVVEGVSESLSTEITRMIAIPTIGIGASAQCDGQILVTPDMLGLFPITPKFVKKYANQRAIMVKAVQNYAQEVKTRAFPSEEYVYKMKSLDT